MSDVKRSTHRIDIRVPDHDPIQVFHVHHVDGTEALSLEQANGLGGVDSVVFNVGSLGQVASALSALNEYFHPAAPPRGGKDQLTLFP